MNSNQHGDSLINLAIARQMGEISEEDFESLAAMLEEDDSLSEYVAFVSDSVALATLTGASAPRREDDGRQLLKQDLTLQAGLTGPGRSPNLGGLAFSPMQWGLRRSHVAVAVLASAASLLLAFAIRLPEETTGHVTSDEDSAPAASVERDGVEYVATLTGAVDCVWANYLASPEYGKPIAAGQSFHLNSGLAQLTFDDGAKVIVQGPAEFVAESAGSGNLRSGKLTALVPRQAVGFRIETPTTDIVDLGTEFGVDVSESGETEVHVLSGEVVFWDRRRDAGDAEPEEGTHLLESEAAFIGSSPEVTRSEAVESKFVRRIVPRLSANERPDLPVTDSLALWLAADMLVKTDDANGVLAWRDIVAGDNQTEEDAWQHEVEHRPEYVPNAIGGKPAVRFDGETSYLVTTPLLSTEAQTLHFVMLRRQAETPFGMMRQIINYNGPPYPLDKSEDIRVLQIDDSQSEGMLWSRYFAGATWADGKVVRIFNVGSASTASPTPLDEPFVLSYRYDPSINEASLYLNGRLAGTDRAPHWRTYTSRKVLGRHPRQDSFFKGDLAEVLIYNGGLTDAQNHQVIEYLMRRYQIPGA